MSARSTLSGKSNDPTVTAPCWAAPSAWSAGALPQAQAQHTIASARQATYATVRRSGAALITFRAGREEKGCSARAGAGDPVSPGGGAPDGRRWRAGGQGGTRAGAARASAGAPALTRPPGAAGTASTASPAGPAASRSPAGTAARPKPQA